MAIVETALADEVVTLLRGGQSVVLATVDAAGKPTTTIISWIVARDNRTLACALDQRGQALQNIRTNGQVAFEVLGDGVNYGCRGRAYVAKDTMTSPPFASALVEITVEEVRNHASPGVVFTGPRYTFSVGKEKRAAVEQAVFDELRRG